jgi:hydrogenase maturation protease
LILGIGNLLMGDEGVGVHVARSLQQRAGLRGVDVVDGGTGGFHLLEYFQRYNRVILVDATLDGRPPGTLSQLRPRFSKDYPRTLTAHDIGLKDLLDAVHLMERQPDVVLFALSVREIDGPRMELSPDVAAAVPEVVEAIVRFLESTSKENR